MKAKAKAKAKAKSKKLKRKPNAVKKKSSVVKKSQSAPTYASKRLISRIAAQIDVLKSQLNESTDLLNRKNAQLEAVEQKIAILHEAFNDIVRSCADEVFERVVGRK